MIALSNGDQTLSDKIKHKRRFNTLIPSVSLRIQNFLDRKLDLTTYTEYFDTFADQLEYFVEGTPISSITTVKSDSTGEFTGNETSESDFYIGKKSFSVVLDTPVRPAKRGLQIVYIGGLTTNGVQSQYVLSTEGSEALVAGAYVEGQTSGAVAYVVTKAGTAITLEILYGIFIVGETIQGKLTEDGADTSNQTAVLASSTVLSLAEVYPDIITAAEYEMRYMDDHRSNFENSSSSKDGTFRRDVLNKNNDKREYDLLPEVRSMLEPYRYMAV